MSPSAEQFKIVNLPFGKRFFAAFMRMLREQDIVSFISVFVAVAAVLKLNIFLLNTFNTSPAVILIPSGIALAAVYLGGYRLWVPIALAWLLVSLTSGSALPPVVLVVGSLGYTLQAVVGAYVLKRLDFLGTMGRTRCALVLITTALLLSIIAPSIATLAQWLTHSLPLSVWGVWSRAWAGNVLSIMVFTPLITTWARDRSRKSPAELIEGTLALGALALAVYLTFWTALPSANIFLILYGLFATLFWIGLRMHPRIVTAALFVVAAFGMAGSFLAHPTDTPLNYQLFADELFIVLIAPIFYILGALVQERRASVQAAEVKAAELEEINRRLALDDQAKNEFLATLAHELRNPLAPVVSSLELLKIKAAELQRPDFMQLVDVAGAHNATLTHLLDDLLDISRISRRKFKLQKESVELHSVIEQARQTVDALYQSRNHTLSVVMPADTLWVEADALRLEQILVNLLNNAAKYTPPGGDIKLDVIFEPQRGLRLSVKDDGIGIEPHMLSKIFEPFIQSKDGHGGLGIGLSLTKRLVELHGGEVWAQSQGLGEGSEFIVVLPITQSVQLPLPTQTRRRGLSLKGEKQSGRTYRILIVDDNRPAAESLGKLLEHGGHSVSIAHDGPTALAAMRGVESEVVLLDIGLPGMDGYTVARSLREEHGYNPLILVALTGFGQEEDKAKAKEAGFNYHLTKPVGIADVEAILTKKDSGGGSNRFVKI